MIRRNTYLLLIVIVAISLASCSKWLELKPQDGIIKEEFWKTKEQVQSAVNGIYASLLGNPYGATVADKDLTEYLWLWGEARADMATPSTAATSEDLEMVNVSILPTNKINNWAGVYRTINYCNTVLQLAPGVLASDPTYTQAQLNAALSEALAIRSLMYFYLVRTFKDVPLKLNATLSDQDIVSLPKVSSDTILNQIIADLKLAQTNAVSTYNNNASDKGRVTKYTISAILADVYLWTNRYTDCMTECDKIISSGQFGLVSGQNASSWFNTLYVNGNSPESIFEFQFDASKTNPFYLMFVGSGRRWVTAGKVLDEVYTVDIVNDPPNIDIRAEGAAVRASDGTIWKYVGATATTLRSFDQSIAHWIVYRYADILLMKAEALNQLGRDAEALALVRLIRERARALPATDITNTGETVASYILSERAREFAFEGKRWYDVLRYARRQYATQPNFLANTIISAVPPARQQSVIARYRDTNSHYLPIYFGELQTNKALVQNPSYR